MPTHRYFPILEAIVAGRLAWAVSNRVLTEYAEIPTRMSGNLVSISPHYQFRIIGDDPDDNAFTDCAIAAHADYVISEDRHFAPLANAGYKPQPITPPAFIERYRGIHVL